MFTEKQLCWSLFLVKLRAFMTDILVKKENPTQAFLCEYCKIFKNSLFYRTPLVDASVLVIVFPRPEAGVCGCSAK